MKAFDVQGIEILTSADEVFDFVADPGNLPRWAKAFSEVQDERARLETPAGVVDIGLRTYPNRDARTVDWRLEFPNGSVALAQSRATETTRGTAIYSFVLHAPPVPLEELEGALAEQIDTLARELHALKALMEA
ncbi:MAG: SRPBCC family protein [Deltaproteobacteria bacterium]|nr:SRPBCC family protein [Deltaproteobacteria bacterium]